MAENEQIGGISVGIVGDYSQLQQDLQAAQQIAKEAGQQIASAIEVGAASADTSALAGALDKVDEAAHGAGSGVKDFETQVSEAVASGHTLAEAIIIATKALEDAGAAASTAAVGLGEAGKAAEDAYAGFQTFSDAAQAVIDKQQGLEQAVTTAAGALQELYRGYEEGTVNAQTLARAQEQLAQATDKATVGTKESGQAAQESGGLFDALSGHVLKMAAAVLSVEAVWHGLTSALEEWADEQRTTLALAAQTHTSFEAAAQVLEKLTQRAMELGLAEESLHQFQLRMTGFASSADQMGRAMTAVADSAAATGRGFDEVSRRFENLIIGGMAGARQLVGLKLTLEDLGNAMGVTASQAAKAFKELDPSDRIEIAIRALEKYSGAAEKTAAGLTGIWQNLKTQLGEALESVGKLLEPLAGVIAKAVSGAMTEIRGLLDSEVIKTAVNYMKIGAIELERSFEATNQKVKATFTTIAEYTGKVVIATKPAKDAVDSLAEAYKQLGIISVAELMKQYNANVDAWQRVVKAYGEGSREAERALAVVYASMEKLERVTKGVASGARQFSTDFVAPLMELRAAVKFDALIADLEKLSIGFESADQSGKGFWERLKTFQDLGPALSKFDELGARLKDLDAAFQSVGKSNATMLKENLDNANKYFAAIRDSGIGTVKELEQADINAQQALIDYMRGTNQAVDEMWAASVQKRQEVLNQSLGQTKQHAEKVSLLWKEVAKDIDRAIEGFAGAISDVILRGEDLGASMKRVLTGIADDIIQLVVKGAIKNWIEALMGVQNQTISVGQSIAKLFGGGGLSAGGGGGIPAGQAPLPSMDQLLGTIGGGGGGGGAGGLGSMFGAAGPAGVIAQIVDTVVQAISIAKVGKDVARIEVTTRGMLNELLNARQDAWDQFNQIFTRMGEIWSAVGGIAYAVAVAVGGATSAQALEQAVNATLNAQAEARRHGTEISDAEAAAASNYTLPPGVGTGTRGSAGIGLESFSSGVSGGRDPGQVLAGRQNLNQLLTIAQQNAAALAGGAPGTTVRLTDLLTGQAYNYMLPTQAEIDATAAFDAQKEQAKAARAAAAAADLQALQDYGARLRSAFASGPFREIGDYPDRILSTYRLVNGELRVLTDEVRGYVTAIDGIGVAFAQASAVGNIRSVTLPFEQLYETIRLVNGELARVPAGLGYVTSVDGIGREFARATQLGTRQWDPATKSYVTRPAPTPMDRGVPWADVYDPRGPAYIPELPNVPEFNSPQMPSPLMPLRPTLNQPVVVQVNLTGGDYAQQQAARLTADKIAEALRTLGQRIN